jgi:2-dehydro-3-deoxyphosphogluconate aldolase/(4S)-4-hydroxy-2-oxoglutarate aldolase
MPTGNVSLETAPEYIRAGAVAVGVGKALADPAAVRAGDWAAITDNARRFRSVVDAARIRPS